MNRAIHRFLWLTVIASAHPLGAQVPAATPPQPVGVKPDITVPANDVLATAQKLAREKLHQ